MQQQPDPAQMQHLMSTMLPAVGLFVIIFWAAIVIPFWQIFKKAGLGGPLSLLMLVPLVNIVMLYVLAFSRWKVVPAPEYAGYPPAYPQPGYAAASGQAVYPPAAGTPPAYVPPSQDSSRF